MDHIRLAERLGRFLRLAEGERQALERLEESERMVPRGAILCAENAPARDIFAVRRGWLYSSMLLPDGNRQILSLHLPGELAGDASLPWATAPFTLTAATDVVVGVIDKAAFRRLFDTHPRLGMMLHALTQAERVALADRMASIGRTSAKARVAALIVDALRRLRRIGAPLDDGFVLPLTQEEIGDATGLTAVHVNRMIRRLAEDGLIVRGGGRMQVIDEARLARIANHVDRFAAFDTGWLTAAR